MIHAGDMTLLDYNRAGTALLEIVTNPDLEIGEEAELFLTHFRRLVRYLGVCDGNMEEGSLRCDANVSVNLKGRGLGNKVEIKNLNSFKFVRKALNFEIDRQEDILERGGTVLQRTRLWNENRDVTESMRKKESAHDYRYFPEPDLPPFRPDKAFFAAVEASLVELPRARRDRMVREFGISDIVADYLTDEKDMADYFESVVRLGADPASAASWIMSDVKGLLNKRGLPIGKTSLNPERLASLLKLLADNRIHSRIAKQTLQAVFERDEDPEDIIRSEGWEQITDKAGLSLFVTEVIEKNPQAVSAVKAGDPKPLAFLVGQAMKLSSGRAEPNLLKEMLKEKLSVKLVHLLSLGGAVIGERLDDGVVGPGDIKSVAGRLSAAMNAKVAFADVEVEKMLSEEIIPENWADLIVKVGELLADGATSGVVIAHGTDTLPYTASLLYWIFGSSPVPIVIAASSEPPLPGDISPSLMAAVERSLAGLPGVIVIVDGKEYSPLNLKFERLEEGGFKNWNTGGKKALQAPLVDRPSALQWNVPSVSRRIHEAVNRSFVAKVYPGMKGEVLIALMKAGIANFILEVYDSGTANLRQGQYSLRSAFTFGKEAGVRFFCTSQQEGIVDFSGYITSRELWKEGAVPMGSLTTESAYTRLLAASLLSETEDEARLIMEDIDESIC
jgi:aspartyl-tRNA(Asn)/glutamyl-tRNA(Gln) amidotransferase subunit B